MFASVMYSKKYLPLWSSHFLSSINNNFIRTVFLFFITYTMTEPSFTLLFFSAIIYALCFSISSLFLGQLADKYPLKKFLIIARVSELILMTSAFGCVLIDSKFLFFCLLPLLACNGAALRIADYSLIPHLVVKKHLNKANAWLRMMTMLGLGIATLFMVSILKINTPFNLVFGVGIFLSFLSLILSCFLPSVPVINPQLTLIFNPKKIITSITTTIQHKFDLTRYIAGLAWFWLILTIICLFAPEYGNDVLQVRWSVIMFLSIIFALGYTCGSVFYIKKCQQDKAGEYSSISCFALGFLLLDLSISSYFLPSVSKDLTIHQYLFSQTCFTYWHILIALFSLGVFSACYTIPFYTLLQLKAPDKMLGRIFGFSNCLNAIFVLGAFLLIIVLKYLFFNLLDTFILLSIGTIIMSLYMLHLLPFEKQQKTWRFILTKLFRVHVEGIENLENAGEKALIVVNHTSFLDILLISAFIKRKIVFAINEHWLQKRSIRILASLTQVKPLDASNALAIKDMVEELKQNKLCMIFTHGLVHDGNTRLKIYEGAAMMAYKSDSPIVPIQIKGAKHTFFSRLVRKKTHFQLFPRISIQILPSVKLKVQDDLPTRQKREKLSSQLYDIINTMAFKAHKKKLTVFEAAIKCMKTVGRFKPILEDTSRKPVKFSTVFLKAFALGQMLKAELNNEQYAGIMLPTSNACSVSVFALHSIGKVPAMINFSSGEAQVISTCKTIGLKKIITARKVISLAKLDPLITALTNEGIEIIYLEEIAKNAKIRHKIFGVFGSLFPKYAYKKASGGKITPHDTAVVLFTSGSEGMPKAVFLSHKNIVSNCTQIIYRVDLTQEDIILCCLPMFHSFGMIVGCFAPLTLGVKSVLYPTPLHYRIIPEVCAYSRATVFVGTDTFLMGYAKCANPYDFNSLRLVVAGAERLKKETKQIWLDKFGVRVLEGYGATECSPILALNTMIHQKNGSVGRLFPGMEYQLKEVEGIKEGKELWVKGPNVMQGYMRHTAPLVLDPPKDGWYDTGDIVSIDDEGFIFIKGRCKRFAKIGGEMVSLLNVETLIQQKWPQGVSGVVNIPDAKKGEKIILITTEASITKEELIALFKAAGAPEIGIPSKVITVEKPPILGTGKFDYVKAKELALEQES